mmetsp:Transcript_40470/g.65217  ORF Transcript_40470/g.65217 Transcript_40470/m.65217 type:complete len:202 (+) Transcript_40470:370-975(+)
MPLLLTFLSAAVLSRLSPESCNKRQRKRRPPTTSLLRTSPLTAGLPCPTCRRLLPCAKLWGAVPIWVAWACVMGQEVHVRLGLQRTITRSPRTRCSTCEVTNLRPTSTSRLCVVLSSIAARWCGCCRISGRPWKINHTPLVPIFMGARGKSHFLWHALPWGRLPIGESCTTSECGPNCFGRLLPKWQMREGSLSQTRRRKT